MDFSANGHAQVRLTETSADEQRFLLNFITGTYLGPDISNDDPKRPILSAKGLRAYESKDLGSSFLTLQQIECLYGYIMKHALRSVYVNLPSLHQYFNNKLPLPKSGSVRDPRQFHHFFPLEKHQQEKRGRASKRFNGIVMIYDPDTSQIPLATLEKFKFLTSRRDVAIDLEDFQAFCNTKKEERIMKRLCQKEAPLLVQPLSMVPCNPTDVAKKKEVYDIQDLPTVRTDNILMLEWHPEVPPASPVIRTGTATQGAIGEVYIGESNSAYLFRVSLPGVDKASVKCEIERNGKITVRGATRTGEAVYRFNHAFIMRKENLPPRGDFTVSFNLPGPVENRCWKGMVEFGLLEGIVGKAYK